VEGFCSLNDTSGISIRYGILRGKIFECSRDGKKSHNINIAYVFWLNMILFIAIIFQ
jgi:hypothetical protein